MVNCVNDGATSPTHDRISSGHSAWVRRSLDQAGNGIGPFDVLIAGHALHAELIPATNNTREFSRVDGLTVEDWLLP